MIYRTYGRRDRDLSRGLPGPSRFGNGVLDSSSHDCSEDVYGDSFPSQECCTDPYDFDSSQESRELTFLKPEVGRGCDADVWKMKKGNVIDLDSDPCSSSGGESQDFEILEITGFQQSRKAKNVVFDSNATRPSHMEADFEILDSKKCDRGRLEFGLKGQAKKRDREGNSVMPKKRKKKKKIKSESKDSYIELTSTLMEAQEGGEMMERLDEMNFSLDGLRKGQPVRVHRASLLSLLSYCGSMQQRRLLRIHGMAKKVVDAITGLNFDDSPSSLAAAALFYILTCDGQDDHLLSSSTSFQFLVKLLKPNISKSIKDKAQPIGSKLIGLCKNAGFLQESANGKDSSSSEIILKVREILVSCKEIKPKRGAHNVDEEPELNHEWIGLLIMEKACSSNFSIEETSGALRKARGKFKEKLREFGGLDAVFEVARKCHCTMEDCLEKNGTFSLDSKDTRWVKSLALLLKCLKTMENATFLSKDNQGHLLGMKGSYSDKQAPRSFVKLILSLIKILSGAFLLRNSENSVDGKSNGSSHENSISRMCSMELASQKSLCASQSSQFQLLADSGTLNHRIESSQTGSCGVASQNIEDVLPHRSCIDLRMEHTTDKRSLMQNSRISDGLHDPFAFDEDDFEPSKWDLLSGSVTKPLSPKRHVFAHIDVSESILSQNELKSDTGHFHSQEASCSSASHEYTSDILADCLLTAVKVLMNLSNENPEGCKQIAACGGLETLSSLIAAHFSLPASHPNFESMAIRTLPSKSVPGINVHINSHLTDQQLDFLVAILGCLVNLVEKDIRNRSSLSKARISLPRRDDLGSEERIDVISLLCSVFLANRSPGDEAGQDEKYFSLEDEESLLQGEKEAEKMIVEAYSALLLAFLSTESKNVRFSIADSLPDRNLKILVPVLERFVEFHRTLDMISPETHATVLEVIESCRAP